MRDSTSGFLEGTFRHTTNKHTVREKRPVKYGFMVHGCIDLQTQSNGVGRRAYGFVIGLSSH